VRGVRVMQTPVEPMSLRLSAALSTSPDFWLKMQIQHDLWQEQQKKQPKIQPKIQPFRRPGAQ
jgi:plasmid maintenance system antidote protein VapI